jgi:hypothetical protein
MELFDYIWPEEEKKLRQANEVWKQVIAIIDGCLHHHHSLIIHSNGTKECFHCRKLWVPERLAHLYPNNPRVILVKEE